jgi:hypothetical protein
VSGSVRASRAGTVRVPIRLSSTARKALAHSGRLGVVLVTRFTGVSEASKTTLVLKQRKRTTSHTTSTHAHAGAR